MFSPGKYVRETFPLKTVDAHPAVAGHLRHAPARERLQLFRGQKDRWPFHASGRSKTVVDGEVRHNRVMVRGSRGLWMALHIARDNAIVLNAEFEESGRLLSDTADVVLEEYERAELRNVGFETAGALNG